MAGLGPRHHRRVPEPAFCLSYLECRDRFQKLAAEAGASLEARPIAARGPDGEGLSLDLAVLGAPRPRRALVTLSGVHGIEGFAASALQQDFLAGVAKRPALPEDAAVLLVHGVNPWGMAHWRRQNESNVDLNRNAVDHDDRSVLTNDGYDELHELLCPVEFESDEAFLERTGKIVAERGFDWVKEAITRGQYRHPRGLYFGGERREESAIALRELLAPHLSGAEEVLSLDLHTGHGPGGTSTLLSSDPLDSEAHAWKAAAFGEEWIEVTVDNPDATTPEKQGQLVPAVLAEIGVPVRRALCFELGTLDDTAMFLAERSEHWLHCHGDPASERGQAIRWRHRVASVPDSREWEAGALAHGRRLHDAALAALFGGA